MGSIVIKLIILVRHILCVYAKSLDALDPESSLVPRGGARGHALPLRISAVV